MSHPVLQAISDRRSVRAYAPDQISETQLAALQAAAVQSPSAMNLQPWHFTFVQDRALLDRISDAARRHALESADHSPRFNDPAFQVFYHAPTVVFISTNDAFYSRLDCGIAAQTLALAAHDLGLGSVILGLPREAFLSEEGDAFRSLLRFPDGHDFAIAVAVGTPAMEKEAHPVLENRVCIIR